MAEPDDPDFLPTEPWDRRDAIPVAPATPPLAYREEETRLRPGVWQPPSAEELQPSFPQFEIRGVIGRGGMGAVYKGWQKSLRRFVAIKILPPHLDTDSDVNFAERFRREAQAMARFAHPGIVAVYDAGETPGGLLYYVMEYVEGTDVHHILATQRRLAPAQAIAITADTCHALAYAHQRGVIHRDIKPSNIMLSTEGQVKVADFGLVKVTDADSQLLTGANLSMGTPDFMAPEAMGGMAKLDHRADLYAVGVMLYQMLTGYLPRGRFAPPSQRVPGLDGRFDAIVDRALQTDPDSRYNSATEIRTDLQCIITEPRTRVSASRRRLAEPPSLSEAATAPFKPQPTPGSLQRNARIYVGLAVGILALLAWSSMSRNRNSPRLAEKPGAVPDFHPETPAPIPLPKRATPPPVTFEPENRLPELLAQGRQSREQGDLAEAASKIREAATLDPANPSLLAELAGIYEKAGSKDDAAEQWRKIEEIDDVAGSYFSLAVEKLMARQDRPTPRPPDPCKASKESPYVNTLGMNFVPVEITGGRTGGQRVLFCIWETRFQDYEVFAKETKRDWPKPGFQQDPTHPAVMMDWNDAREFCQWLTKRENSQGKLAESKRYRLPTDHEWSCAAGIGDRENAAQTPAEKDKKVPGVFPWGAAWPPPPGAGNYSGEEAVPHADWPDQKAIAGYRDGYPNTAPIGSFTPNPLGLFDMGGNVWEWCEDAWSMGNSQRTLRGASFVISTREILLSSARHHLPPATRADSAGFRCVLADEERVARPSFPGPLNSPDFEWSNPENLGPGVNSAKDEYALGISDDGLVMILSSTQRGQRHLLECRRKTVHDQFGEAVLIKELAATGAASSPFLSADGLTLLYSSSQHNRQSGKAVIYESHRKSRESPWTPPLHVVLPGGSFFETSPRLSADGLSLWFASNRPGGHGGFDLWRARRAGSGAPFGQPENFGDGVNTDADEFFPRAGLDGRTVIFFRERNGGEQQILEAAQDKSGVWTTEAVSLPFNEPAQSPTLSADGLILYFASEMPGGFGGWDLWQIRRIPKRRQAAQ